jgi:uncharacterized protein YwlG (UPF0340 family)
MEVHAAVAINVKAVFTGLTMIGAETATAIGTNFRTQSSADVTVDVMNNLDSAVRHKAIFISSQTNEHVSQPARKRARLQRLGAEHNGGMIGEKGEKGGRKG